MRIVVDLQSGKITEEKDAPVVIPDNYYEQLKEAKVNELKNLLKDSDYVALADYDKEKPELLKSRQEWRDELRKLENE